MKSASLLGLVAIASLAALAALAVSPAFGAAPSTPVPIRADHPLIGAWELTTRDGGCVETWRIDRAGTGLVTSADEVAETRFTVADQPSERGYFKWVDTVVKDNGKKDCGGSITKPPVTATNYILMNPAHDRFILCTSEDGKRCFGPFVKVQGGEI